MNFGLALKKLNAGKELTRGNKFTLSMEKGSIMRTTKNGAKTIARVTSNDLLANDWSCTKS